MELEVWFDKYQYAIDYDIGESAVKTLAVEDLEVDLEKILLRYGYHSGRPDLRACIAEQYPGLGPDHIIITTGASEANFTVVAALVKPGDHVVIEHPNYPSLYEVPRSLGCDASLLSLKYENHFKPDLDELKSKITPATKLVSLTHPNNPTGSIISEKDLREVIDVVESYKTFLLFDETYRHMAYGENLLPPAASLSDRAVSITGMSKCYGLPGTRTGWLATTNQFLLEAVVAIREQLSISNNTLGEEIALSVLKRKDAFLTNARKRIMSNREIVAAWIEKHDNFEWVYPAAGVVCFPRIKEHVAVDPDRLYRHLAEEYKTFVVPGSCFEMDNRHFRIGFGADVEEIQTGLSNLDKALSDLVS
jgi:aspartate/methionine/tyrosine aminotransferase